MILWLPPTSKPVTEVETESGNGSIKIRMQVSSDYCYVKVSVN